MRRALAVLLGVALGMAAPRANAGPALQRVVIDRVDLEPSPLWGFARLRVYASAINLGEAGKVMPIYGDGAWKLHVAGSSVDVPYIAGLYDGTDTDTAIVLVVEKAFEYQKDLHAIQESLDGDFLAKLPPKTQVAVIGYGDDVVVGKLGTVKAAQARLAQLATEDAAGSPDLVRALNKAMSLLQKVKTEPEGRPVRKLILVVSDGVTRDADADKARITTLARKAAKQGIRIDAIAYLAEGEFKGPLRNLGELAKQSLGVYRWAQTPDAIPNRIQNAQAEVAHQYVLTWLVPVEDVAGKKITVAAQVSASQLIESSPGSVPEAATCGGNECPADGYCAASRCVVHATPKGRGIFGWILIIVGIAGGLLVVLWIAGTVFTKLKRKPVPPPGIPIAVAKPGVMPAVAPQPAAPVAMPAAPVTGPQIYMMTGPRTGERIALRHGFLIGKQPGCDLVLDQDGFASSQHAQILMDQAGNCTLVDKGSTNGTFVNGVRVTQYALTHGVAIRVGSTDFRFLAQ